MRMSSESAFKHGSFSGTATRVSHDCPVRAARSEVHDGKVNRRGHKLEAINAREKRKYGVSRDGGI